MAFHGKNFIGGSLSAEGTKHLRGTDPRSGQELPDVFTEATPAEIDRALALAAAAAPVLREKNAEEIGLFLDAVAGEIEALGDILVEQAATESGLTKDRLTGERARTANQLRLFSSLARDGSFVDARIDTALPERKPLPRPDLRRMLVPIGPVAVFGASNFPLAFSVAGGDTASALAARNPVIVKAHPAHPGTCELVAGAIRRAVDKQGFPEGAFSMLHAADPAISILLVKHPATKAVGFTGSERAGRAIFDAAARRPEPIPAYVEMGSSNPVFLLPQALEASGDGIAQSLFASINLGVGQFCTSPGVVIGDEGEPLRAFSRKLAGLFEAGAPGTMLHPGILSAYSSAVERRAGVNGVATFCTNAPADKTQTQALPVLFETEAETWMANPDLASEIFGPSAVLVRAKSKEDLLRIAANWHGTLTASIFGTAEDLFSNRDLISILERKAGRLLFNGFPTGVEVTHAMHHGGPYPATADSKFTSVGTAAVYRFLRPVCYQGFPQQALPLELRDENPRALWRLINGNWTRDPVRREAT